MSTMHELAQRLMALDDRITACMKCGMCQAVCPMFGASGMEADVARGKLALLDNLAHEMIQDPAAVSDKLGRCLLCGSCQASCPPGVKIMDVFMEAREIVNTYLGMHPVKKMIFRAVLPQPGVFNLAMRMGAPVQGLIFRSTGSAQGTVCARTAVADEDAEVHWRRDKESARSTLRQTDAPEAQVGEGARQSAHVRFPGCAISARSVWCRSEA